MVGMGGSGNLAPQCWPSLFLLVEEKAIVSAIVFVTKIAAAAKQKIVFKHLFMQQKLSHSKRLSLSTIVENFTSCTAKIVKIKLFTLHAEKRNCDIHCHPPSSKSTYCQSSE